VAKLSYWQEGNNGGILQKLASRKLSELCGKKYRWENCQNCEEENTGGKTVRTVRKEI
jgi:hypothetical protein